MLFLNKRKSKAKEVDQEYREEERGLAFSK